MATAKERRMLLKAEQAPSRYFLLNSSTDQSRSTSGQGASLAASYDGGLSAGLTSRTSSIDSDMSGWTDNGSPRPKHRKAPSEVADPEKIEEHVEVEGCVNIVDKRSVGTDVMCLGLDSTCQFVSVGCCNGEIPIYNLNDFVISYTLKDAGTARKPVTCTQFVNFPGKPVNSPSLLTCHTNGHINLWNVKDNRKTMTLKEENDIYALGVNTACNRFVSGGKEPRLRLYDLLGEREIGEFSKSDQFLRNDGPTMRVYSIKFKPRDNNVFVSGGWDNCLHIWDARVEHSVRHIYGPHVAGDALRFKSNGDVILAGSWNRDCPLGEYDFRSGKSVGQYPDDAGFRTRTYSCGYMGHRENVVFDGGSKDNTLRIVNTCNNDTVGRVTGLDQGVYDVVACPAENVKYECYHPDRIPPQNALQRLVADDTCPENAYAGKLASKTSPSDEVSVDKWCGYLAFCSGKHLYIASHAIR